MPNEYPTKALAQRRRRKGERTVKVVHHRKKGAPKHLPKKLTMWVNRKVKRKKRR